MEFIFFTAGDSRLASTWSNVPFLMSYNFECKGHILHRINIAPNKILNKCFNIIGKTFFRWNKGYEYMRTPMYRFITEKKIKRAVKKYHNSDFCIFLTFSFNNNFNTIPSLIFSDWSYEMLINERLSQTPSKRDLNFIEKESEIICNSEIVLPLFLETYNKFKIRFPNSNIFQIPFNVINNMSEFQEGELSEEQLDIKYKSKYIVFVGRPTYKEGLYRLIDALKDTHRNIEIAVIGMTEKEGVLNNNVKYYGFLHKENHGECNLYYDIIKNAKCIINPTPQWAAYSSIVEGMYFYNPVIVTPFIQFVVEFGKQLDFGIYVRDVESLKLAIEKMFTLSKEKYFDMARKAHDRVKDYTWNRYTDEMISLMSKYLSKE